ncbi:phage shock protein C (PspC) family protein [Piscibacillus halophilus]|uniref:Phage shock protein C (PspC) family protein n=2 Tax=Piscibacillus halophilus TaxID=571933 RepID=A0A1H9H190_9BACI|nr:phage shock protein C (PspC) family protein [Piscibacillus halophilus]
MSLMKANHDKALFGICGGIAEYLSIPSLAVRLIFVFTLPMSFIIYIFLIILMNNRNPYEVRVAFFIV